MVTRPSVTFTWTSVKPGGRMPTFIASFTDCRTWLTIGPGSGSMPRSTLVTVRTRWLSVVTDGTISSDTGTSCPATLTVATPSRAPPAVAWRIMWLNGSFLDSAWSLAAEDSSASVNVWTTSTGCRVWAARVLASLRLCILLLALTALAWETLTAGTGGRVVIACHAMAAPATSASSAASATRAPRPRPAWAEDRPVTGAAPARCRRTRRGSGWRARPARRPRNRRTGWVRLRSTPWWTVWAKDAGW